MPLMRKHVKGTRIEKCEFEIVGSQLKTNK